MRLPAFCFVAMASLAIVSPALAQSWQVYHEEDYVTATVMNGASEFGVTCTAGEPDPVYSFTTMAFVAPPGMRSTEMVLKIDDQDFFWPASPISNESRYDMVGETMNPSNIIQVNDLLSNGRELTVSIPSLNISSKFSLAGSSRALDEVLNVCYGDAGA